MLMSNTEYSWTVAGKVFYRFSLILVLTKPAVLSVLVLITPFRSYGLYITVICDNSRPKFWSDFAKDMTDRDIFLEVIFLEIAFSSI